MVKQVIFILLFCLYLVYGGFVYTYGTETAITLPAKEAAIVNKGKDIYQRYNCTACHQLYGLGGYLGPELTTAWSDPLRGEAYLRALLKGGGLRMPNFKFSEEEINALLRFLKYVDSTAITYKDNRK